MRSNGDMDEKLKERRVKLVDRINYLVATIPQLQSEELALRGQLQLIAELLGEIPAPPAERQEPEPPPPDKPARSKRRG